MTLTQKHLLSFISAAVFLVAVYLFINTTLVAKASAPPGAPATIASSTLAFVNTTAAIVIATSSCNARIISTASTSVMLTLSDYNGASPNNTFGIFQGASTTVVYDSGQYGCGLVKAYGFTAGQITVTDVR